MLSIAIGKQHRLLQRNQIQGSISALRDIAVAGAMTVQSGTADSTVAEVIDDIVCHLRTVPDVQMCANLAEVTYGVLSSGSSSGSSSVVVEVAAAVYCSNCRIVRNLCVIACKYDSVIRCK